MKKLVAIVFALVLVSFVAGCASQPNPVTRPAPEMAPYR